MAESIRVGVVGANVSGWAGRAHLPALVRIPGVQLAAVCTTREESARESAAKFGAPKAYHDYREMVRDPDLDVIAVVVRVPSHYEPTMAAIEAGKHVYTEWPLGANTKEAEEMAALAKRNGVQTVVGLQVWQSAEVTHMRHLIDEGFVGDVLAVHMVELFPGVLSRAQSRIWQGRRSAGANQFTIQFGHAIEGFRRIVGDFAELSAIVRTQVPEVSVDGTTERVTVDSPDSILVQGMLSCGAVASVQVGGVPTHGTGHRMEVFGRKGSLVLTNASQPHIGASKLLGAQGSAALQEIEIPAHGWVSEHGLEGAPVNVGKTWIEFAHALSNGGIARPNFDDALSLHRLLDAIQRSSDTGTSQKL